MNRHPFRVRRGSKLMAALAAAGLVTALPLTANAAGEAQKIKDLERKLERSLQLIEELSAKVNKLENAKTDAGNKNLSDSVTKQNERIEGIERQVTQLGSGLGKRADEGVPLHGFADLGYTYSDRGNAQASGPKGFGVGSFDLYLTPQFGDRVKALVELIFEVEESGNLLTDLERVQIGYTFSDAATFWAGRIHTPYGFWNTGFHHGAQIQTSILRPRFLDFEDKGGILPAHVTGAWLTGNIRTGDGKVNYDLYAGNGPDIRGIDTANSTNTGALTPNAGRDDNHNAMVGFNVGYNFTGAAEGLRLGLHGFKMSTSAYDSSNRVSRTDVRVSGLYGTYITDDWEVLGEWYRFNNRTQENRTTTSTTAAGSTHSSNAWFLQVGKNFGLWTPFARAEKTSLDRNDLYFHMQASGIAYTRGALGLRYDMNPKTSLKLELNRTRQNGTNAAGTVDDNYSEARVQWAIRF